MDNKEKLILKQVSLKAAANVGGTVEEVLANATTFNEWLLKGADQVTTASKPTSAGNGAVFEPK